MTDLMPRKPAREARPTGPGADEESVRLEQELFEQRRRASRRPRWKRVVAVVLVVLLLGAGVWAVGFSSLLASREVQVTGTQQLAPVEVRAAARVPMGTPLARIDLAAVRERVSVLPEVRSVQVSRAWPHGVRIAVTERTAVAVVPRGDGFLGLSADGVLFRRFPTRPAGLPVVRDDHAATRGALSEAATVAGELPADVRTRVDHLTVFTADKIVLVLRSGRSVVWGDSSASAEKGAVLAALLKRPGKVIDVSVPGRPTTR